jgi:hypothetical protein
MSDISTAPTSEDAAEPTNQRAVLLLAVAAAAVIAALLGYFLVMPIFASPATTATAAGAKPTPSASVTASATPSPSATRLRNYGGTIGRADPFKPLLNENAAVAGAGAGASASAGTGTGTGTGTTGSATTVPTRVSVVEVQSDSSGSAVMVRMDTTIHIATTGETIAGVLKVVAITGKGATGKVTFLYGDQRFTLGEGQGRVLG